MLPEHPHLLHCVVTDCHVSPIACDQLKGEDQAFFIFVSPAKAMGSLKKKKRLLRRWLGVLMSSSGKKTIRLNMHSKVGMA